MARSVIFRTVDEYNNYVEQFISNEFKNNPDLWKITLGDVVEMNKNTNHSGLSPGIEEMEISE